MGLERIRLTPGAVEREDQLLAEPLPVGVGRDQRLELGHQPLLPSGGELDVVAQLQRRQPQLLQRRGLDGQRLLMRQIGERRSRPEGERRAEVVGRRFRLARRDRPPTVLDEPSEPVEIELVRLDP